MQHPYRTSPLARTASLLTLGVLLLVAGGGVLLYLAYGVDQEIPEQAILPQLEAPVEIAWYERGLAAVDAQGEADAYRALGFVHGTRRAWQMALLRQAATGRLAEWFGDGALGYDRFLRRLGLADLARTSFAELPAEQRRLLRAYTEGANAALGASSTAFDEAFVLLDVTPAPWEPWHTLAVERLVAWLATAPPDSAAQMGPDAAAFFESDRRLRTWLHLHSFENSLAWTVDDSTGTHFFQRHVFGASALPFFQEVVLQWPGRGRLLAASLPGTPFLPAGRSDERAWSLLLSGTLTFEYTLVDTAAVPLDYQRITSADGTEYLLTTRRTRDGLFFDPPPRPPAPVDTAAADTMAAGLAAVAPADTVRGDSTWVLRWAGFRPGTDVAAWAALAAGRTEPFSLLDGDGLLVTPSGAAQVLGDPAVVVDFAGGLLVGNAPWARYVAARLDSLTRPARTRPAPLADLLLDFHSPWAEATAPPLVTAATAIPNQPELVVEALTYLRNWDYDYSRSSIGASIFDTWVALYRDSTGVLPTPEVPDTLYTEHLLRYRLLVQAVDTLTTRFGPELSQWRWENVRPKLYTFPTWTATPPEEAAAPLLPNTRYAPVELPGAGHPSTLYWGPSPIQDDLLAPASWEAWLSTRSWDVVQVRRPRFDAEAPLGRYLILNRLPEPVPLQTDAPPRRTTTLLPRPAAADV